jgi:acyl-CoA reductase-like NAD-dependent aldehyde dehydrogenase
MQSQKVQTYFAEGITKKGSHHILPTIFDKCTLNMKIATEETFGPTIAVFKFKTEEEVIKMANNSPYGIRRFCMDY